MADVKKSDKWMGRLGMLQSIIVIFAAYMLIGVAIDMQDDFLGDAENFKLKLASYEHTENNSESVTANAEEKVEKGLDPLGRGQMYQAVPIDDTYPEYILNNQDKYSKLIKPWK